MIEASNLLKELADQKSELGKLSNMDSDNLRDSGSFIYDGPLTKPDPGDFICPDPSPWYEGDVKFPDYIDDDLLDSLKEQEVSAESENAQNDIVEQASDAEDIGKEGGRYQDLKDEGWGWNTNPPTEVHHMPAASSSQLERCNGPAIVMDYEDHRETASCGNSREAQEYRNKQKELIEQGKFREAFQMDVDDIREKFGDKYDEAISKAEAYLDQLEKENKI